MYFHRLPNIVYFRLRKRSEMFIIIIIFFLWKEKEKKNILKILQFFVVIGETIVVKIVTCKMLRVANNGLTYQSNFLQNATGIEEVTGNRAKAKCFVQKAISFIYCNGFWYIFIIQSKTEFSVKQCLLLLSYNCVKTFRGRFHDEFQPWLRFHLGFLIKSP